MEAVPLSVVVLDELVAGLVLGFIVEAGFQVKLEAALLLVD